MEPVVIFRFVIVSVLVLLLAYDLVPLVADKCANAELAVRRGLKELERNKRGR